MKRNIDIFTLTDERFLNDIQKIRTIRVLKPKDYNASSNKRYPVIYMHDGQNLFDDKISYAGSWKVIEALEKLEIKGFSGAIVVGIDNTSERLSEYVYNFDFLDDVRGFKKSGTAYMNFIVDILKPFIDSNYLTLSDRENTVIAGSSLGGLISLFGGLENINIFGNIIAFSPSLQFINNELLVNKYFSNLNSLAKDTKYFFYVGDTNDGNPLGISIYKDKLIKFGVNNKNIKTLVGIGYSHNELAWSTFLPNALKFIFDILEDD